MVSDLLRQRGFQVFEAMNADEAIAIFRSEPDIDLVVTDMRMRSAEDVRLWSISSCTVPLTSWWCWPPHMPHQTPAGSLPCS
jgi:hypothetical protein